MMFDDSFNWVRFPDEEKALFDDRISYDDALIVLSDEVTGNPELLEKLKQTKSVRNK